MKNHRVWLLGVIATLIIAGPVAYTQLKPHKSRPMTGVPLKDLAYAEVTFRNEHQDLDLAGLLFMPPGAAPCPAAVIIHGSGTSRRNSYWYSTLTSELLDRGIAVLLPDKRGSEQSGGDWRSASFADLATDTRAAVEYLVALNEARFTRIGVVGMSQGGWIAPVAASQDRRIEFVVSFSGATVTPPEQLYFEEVHNLQQVGFLPGVSHLIAGMSTTYIQHVGQREFWNEISKFDPLPYWQELDVEALLLFGADDSNVPVAESVERIEALGLPSIGTVVFEGSGHALEEPPEQGSRIIRADALDAMAEFILQTR